MIYLEIWFFRLVTSVGKRKILRTHEELNDGPSDFALGYYEDHLSYSYLQYVSLGSRSKNLIGLYIIGQKLLRFPPTCS